MISHAKLRGSEFNNIASLDLSKNFLRDEGVRVLSEAFLSKAYSTPTLVHLNLANNELTYKGVKHLCKALSIPMGCGSSLIHLNLSNVDPLQKNRIGWQGG